MLMPQETARTPNLLLDRATVRAVPSKHRRRESWTFRAGGRPRSSKHVPHCSPDCEHRRRHMANTSTGAGFQLRSTVKKEGILELSLVSVLAPEPKPEEVIV